MSQGKEDLLTKAWALAYRVATRPSPPGTVALPGTEAEKLLNVHFERFLDRFDNLPSDSEFLAAISTWARELSLDHIAHARESSDDRERYRKNGAHERNLDLRKLRPPPESMDPEEWNALDDVLRPCGYSVLKSFKELSQEDKEEIYSKSLTDLYKGRQSDGRSPLDQVRVFEEVFPFFSRIVHLAAKKHAERRRPTEDLDAISEEPCLEPGRSFAELRFECEEALNEAEWDLVNRKFMAGETDTELIESEPLLESLGIDTDLALISRRRHLKGRLAASLEKLAVCLKEIGPPQ